jgi:hypothetical protein
MQAFNILLPLFLLAGQTLRAQDSAIADSSEQGEPVFTLSETMHDFGLINETDGLTTHVFRVKNTGTAPLIIKHVQTSCGCTEPEWTRKPIEPGKQGDVVVTFDPTNRPGPFRKNIAVYTNEKVFRRQLSIKGDVVPKSRTLSVILRDTIGTVLVEQKTFPFHTVRAGNMATKEIWIRNFSEEDITLSIEDIPDYVSVEAPAQLKSGKTERLKVTVDGTKADRKERRLSHFVWKATGASGAVVTQTIPLSVNFVDDFTALTPDEKSNSPAIQISATLLEYGVLKKSGFLGLGNKRVSRQITLTNTGKSALIIHSITSDDARVQIAGFSTRTLRPEESLVLTVSLSPKNISDSLATDIYIICNDPRGPVRQISITAER